MNRFVYQDSSRGEGRKEEEARTASGRRSFLNTDVDQGRRVDTDLECIDGRDGLRVDRDRLEERSVAVIEQ